jgi:hypothetical protein
MAIVGPPPDTPTYTGDPDQDSVTYQNYMNDLYTYKLKVSSYQMHQATNAEAASGSKEIPKAFSIR